MGKAIILSAPSGAGKTTIVKALIKRIPSLEFSVSATTRSMRPGEVHGRDYFFLTEEEFRQKISNGNFVEYEEVYKGLFYGTLKEEVERIWAKGNHVIFDVDVKGGVNLKRKIGNAALLFYIMPPSVEALEQRLRARATDDEETIRFRIARAREELDYASQFDVRIINDILDNAIENTYNKVMQFISE